MSTGRLFDHDHWGMTTTPSFRGAIAGRYRACWVGTKGDQAYIKKAFKLSGSCVSKTICHACKAGPLNKPTSGAGLESCIPEGHFHTRQIALRKLRQQCGTQSHVSRLQLYDQPKRLKPHQCTIPGPRAVLKIELSTNSNVRAWIFKLQSAMTDPISKDDHRCGMVSKNRPICMASTSWNDGRTCLARLPPRGRLGACARCCGFRCSATHGIGVDVWNPRTE